MPARNSQIARPPENGRWNNIPRYRRATGILFILAGVTVWLTWGIAPSQEADEQEDNVPAAAAVMAERALQRSGPPVQGVRDREAALELGTAETREARELAWAEEVKRLKRQLGVKPTSPNTKSADWKVAVAALMKERTAASNRWLAEHLEMGSMFTVSRMTTECRAGRRATKTHQLPT